MPIALKTDLKTIKFGHDRFGYGSSGLPYIQTQIPETPNSPGLQKPIFNPITNSNLDYPIRGGSVAFEIGQQTYTLSSQIDRSRIAAFLKDQPRGTNFIQKQIGLQMTNPKMETAMSYGMFQNTRVYNDGKNTLAQVAASGTGAHAVRHGTVPFNPLQKNYFATVNEQNILGGPSAKGMNRLVILNTLKMSNAVTTIIDPEQARSLSGGTLNMSKVNDMGISLNRNLLFQYLGGPGSTYGIGATTIKRFVDTTQMRSSRVMNYDLISKQNTKNNANGVSKNIQDFRAKILKESQDPNLIFEKEFHNFWTADSPENNTVQYRFYIKKENTSTGVDKINSLYPFGFENGKAPWEVDRNTTDDLIKFVFEAISNDNTAYSTAIFFRAFLNSAISDNNSAVLNSFKYIGRGENFYTYQGFDRTIGFSFRVAAESQSELKPMYNRLNALVSQVYPDYSPNTYIMRAPLMRITVGDYIYRMPGMLENVSLTVDNGTPWEINLYNDRDLAQLPQVVDVTVSFKPILSELPRRYGSGRVDTAVNSSINPNTNTATTTVTNTTEISKIIANTTESDFITPSVQAPTNLPPNSYATQRRNQNRDRQALLGESAVKGDNTANYLSSKYNNTPSSLDSFFGN